MISDPLLEQLRLLVAELRDDVKLILGGGYGLVLRTEHIRNKQIATRFEDIPEARSTNDLDLFLSVEIITSTVKIEKIRDALKKLGYKPIAKFFQFRLPINFEGLEKNIKIDLLSVPVDESVRGLVEIKKPRIKPRGAKEIHAFLTEEAVTLEENLLAIDISLNNSPLEIYLPHPFSYLVMKLFALRDRLNDEEKDFGAYHAFDIYRIIAMMTEKEWLEAEILRDKYLNELKIMQARQIVEELFSNYEYLGVLRVRQHAVKVNLSLESDKLEMFVQDLLALFPKSFITNITL